MSLAQIFLPPRSAVAALLLAGACSTPVHAAEVAAPWQDLAQAPQVQRDIQPQHARWLTMDSAALLALAHSLPDASAEPSRRPRMRVPLPDGRSVVMRLHATAVMAPELAARYPQIRSFAGTVEGQPDIRARFDISPRGLRAQIFTPQGQVYIDPLTSADARLHQVYFTRDLPPSQRPADKVLEPPAEPHLPAAAAANTASGVRIGAELRTYRLAVATTGEYARFHDPAASPSNKTRVLAELVTLTNRVSGVYERDLGIALQLVAHTDALIYTDPNTDPYSNTNGSAMLGQNISTLAAVLGNDSFDIGHVVSTGGGGVAYLRAVCKNSSKAGGVTGQSKPINDAFYIDYVAHEMGHQLGGNHTFNSSTGSCQGNRAAKVAYEPGSGTTIMAYAGICGADDIQPHSDPQFHAASFDEVVSYTRNGAGSNCGSVTPTGNHAPRVKVPAGGFTLPANTPFELTGSASDADGHTLSYSWEEFDLGSAGSPDQPAATAPLFRSFPPSSSPTRVFPQPSDLLNNRHTLGELLPATSRDMNFRLTVRDNQAAPSAGGVASADLAFKVSADAGPFKLLSPNGPGQYRPGATLTVQWDVANTQAPPVSCAAVDVWLSTDGGHSFGRKLQAAAPNTGSTRVTLPKNSATAQARLKLKCSSSVFFDVSDANFSIQ